MCPSSLPASLPPSLLCILNSASSTNPPRPGSLAIPPPKTVGLGFDLTFRVVVPNVEEVVDRDPSPVDFGPQALEGHGLEEGVGTEDSGGERTEGLIFN